MHATQAQIDADERAYNDAVQRAERDEDERVAAWEHARDMALMARDHRATIDNLLSYLVRAGKADVATTAAAWMTERRDEGRFDDDLASLCIGRLKAHLVGTPYEQDKPRTAAAPKADQGDDIPDGYYAVEYYAAGTAGRVRFYRVKTDSQGRRWVDPFNSRGRVNRAQVYADIRRKGIDASAALFADLLDKCCDCGRPLTNQESRDAKRGPDCRAKRAAAAALVLVVDDEPPAGGLGE